MVLAPVRPWSASRDDLKVLLKHLPDMERLLARVRMRACKVADFLELLEGFHTVASTVEGWAQEEALKTLASRRVKELLTAGKRMPDLTGKPGGRGGERTGG